MSIYVTATVLCMYCSSTWLDYSCDRDLCKGEPCGGKTASLDSPPNSKPATIARTMWGTDFPEPSWRLPDLLFDLPEACQIHPRPSHATGQLIPPMMCTNGAPKQLIRQPEFSFSCGISHQLRRWIWVSQVHASYSRSTLRSFPRSTSLLKVHVVPLQRLVIPATAPSIPTPTPPN